MRISTKVAIAAALVLLLTTSLLSLTQINQVRDTLRQQVETSINESSTALARRIEAWPVRWNIIRSIRYSGSDTSSSIST